MKDDSVIFLGSTIVPIPYKEERFTIMLTENEQEILIGRLKEQFHHILDSDIIELKVRVEVRRNL